MLREAGINMDIFVPHSTLAASTSHAVGKVPFATILSTAGWSHDSTFRKYYKKHVVGKGTAEAVLSAKARQ